MRAPTHIAENKPPTVLLIDRQPLFAAAASSLLSAPPISAVVEIRTRLESATGLSGHNIDLIICELRSEPMTGPDLVAALKRQRHSIPVILLGDASDKMLMLEALQSGAAGLFDKNTPADAFEGGVMAVLQGYRTMGPSLLEFSLATALKSLRSELPRRQLVRARGA